MSSKFQCILVSLFLIILVIKTSESILTSANSICDEEFCDCDSYSKVMCNCTEDYQSLTIGPKGRQQILPTATQITIVDCLRVSFLADSIKHLRELRKIKIYNTQRLMIGEDSLAWRTDNHNMEMQFAVGVHIVLHNATINEIGSHAIRGQIEHVLITNSIIEDIRPFAFSNLIGTKSIEIKNSTIKNVQTKAFKKFSVDLFLIKDTQIRSLTSRTLSDLTIRESLTFDTVFIDKIRSIAVEVEAKTILLHDCKINTIEGDAFRVLATSPVIVHGSVFTKVNAGAFEGIKLFKDLSYHFQTMNFIFKNNTILEFEKGSLKLDPSYSLKITNLRMDKECQCADQSWKQTMPSFEKEIMCFIKHPNNTEEKEFKHYYMYQDENCYIKKLSIMIISSICVTVIAVVIIIVLAIVYALRRVGYQCIAKSKASQNNLPIILPDGKTYRQTEIHMIVERNELLTTAL